VYWGEASLSADARAGLRLFLSPRTGCAQCHAGFNLSGPVAHALRRDAAPTFHEGVRAPTLRNVAVTAPYFHDGRYDTLGDVLKFYDRQGHDRAIPLGSGEQRALLAFLESLTDRCWVTEPLPPPSTRSHPRAPGGCPHPP
jgi:cytochrome c peroxidase